MGEDMEATGLLPCALLGSGFLHSAPTVLNAFRKHEGKLQPQVPLLERPLVGKTL